MQYAHFTSKDYYDVYATYWQFFALHRHVITCNHACRLLMSLHKYCWPRKLGLITLGRSMHGRASVKRGFKKMPKVIKIPQKIINKLGTVPDAKLAEEIGVSKMTISVYRRKLGIDSYKSKGRQPTAKRTCSFAISPQIIKHLENQAKKTGKSKSFIVEQALSKMFD